MPIPNLETVALGSPVTRLGISFFPVYLMGSNILEMTGETPDCLAIDSVSQVCPGNGPVPINPSLL